VCCEIKEEAAGDNTGETKDNAGIMGCLDGDYNI